MLTSIISNLIISLLTPILMITKEYTVKENKHAVNSKMMKEQPLLDINSEPGICQIFANMQLFNLHNNPMIF